MNKLFKDDGGLTGKWIANKNALEYLGVWKKINNPGFNYPEFGVIKNEAGTKVNHIAEVWNMDMKIYNSENYFREIS